MLDPKDENQDADESINPEEASSEEESNDEGIELVEVVEDPIITDLRSQLTDSNKEVSELTARLRTVSAAYQKQLEEVPAIKERIERQMNYRESKRRGEVVSILFEPVENLRRSIEIMKKAEVENSHIEGLDLVVKSFMDGFNKLGLQEISPKGELFDPNFHEALVTMPVQDPVLDDTVVEVYSIGYRIDKIVVIPAKVIVGKYTAPPEESSSEATEDTTSEETEDNHGETD